MDGTAIRQDDLNAIASALWKRGVENVVITLGSNGSAVVRADGIQYIPCVKMEHVEDPTAAGDSFVGALSVGLTIGLSQEQALAFASHTAAITVSRMGAMPSLPTLAEVILLLEDRSYDGFQISALDALK
jgi:ribokinase